MITNGILTIIIICAIISVCSLVVGLFVITDEDEYNRIKRDTILIIIGIVCFLIIVIIAFEDISVWWSTEVIGE